MASSVAPVPPNNILDLLPARPPTPPREALPESDTKSVARRASAFVPKLFLHTPPNTTSPTSVTTDSGLDSGFVRKRVEWSTHTDYRDAPRFHGDGRQHKPPKSSEPSSVSSRPVKGILKPVSSTNQLAFSFANDTDESPTPLKIIEMLDSTITQLAGSDRTSKLDAYMILSRALKASDNLPDRVALQNKMSLLMQFIQRDIKANMKDGAPDSSLVKHALTLLTTFLHFPAIASALTNDFGVFILDHAIRSFEDDAMPKDVIRHFMQVVALQKFSSKVLSSDRVGRLISAFHSVDKHLRGKSIVVGRLQIYKRLVKQSRAHMCTHSDWLKDLFTDMLSTVKDIRTQAISLGMEAGYALRSEKTLLRKVTELLQTVNEEGETYIKFYLRKLQELMTDKQSCSTIPQIWSVVILFLKCPLDKWQYYSAWLTLAQSAFNASDSITKQEANFAWNRYVALSLSDSRIPPKGIHTLCQPLLSQLRRKVHPKHQDDAIRLRKAVIGGICNLYYYIFAPGNVNRYAPELTWDIVVQPVVDQLVSTEGSSDTLGDDVLQAARLLVGIIDVATPRVWRQDRIMELPPVRSEELPAIDSKWTRRNSEKVLNCVGLIIEKRFCRLADDEDPITRLWRAVIKSVAVASAKDIKVSEETAKFVGCALGLLSKILATCVSDRVDNFSNAKLRHGALQFIQPLVEGLGILPFTEGNYLMTASNTFQPTSTPSHRPDRSEHLRVQGEVRPALHHLIIMLSTVPACDVDGDELMGMLHSIFEPFLRGKTLQGRLSMMGELLQLIPRDASPASGLWMLTVDCAQALFNQAQGIVSSQNLQTDLDLQYQEVIRLLEYGLSWHCDKHAEKWLSLLSSVTTRALADYGDAGCSLVVTIPLAKALLDAVAWKTDGSFTLHRKAAGRLLSSTKMPRDEEAWEAARTQIPGKLEPLSSPGLCEPFNSLFEVGSHFLKRAYESFKAQSIDGAVGLFEALDEFFKNNSARIPSLVKLQDGLALWIQDSDKHLSQHAQVPLLNKITNTWDQICSGLAASGLSQRQELRRVEPLLAAALVSTHKSIVKRTLVALSAIMTRDEAAFSESFAHNISSFGPLESQEIGRAGVRAGSQEQHRNVEGLSPASTQSACANFSTTDSGPPKRRSEETPDTTRRKQARRLRTPKHRRRDRHIKFDHVPSSASSQEESRCLAAEFQELETPQVESQASPLDMPPYSSKAPAHQDAESEKVGYDRNAESKEVGSTPRHSKSFDNLIRLTPTPRRGEFVQMDDSNDLPSSPLQPRPYPLLVEIQSRSRIDSTMENWEFSSPPGSPLQDQSNEAAEVSRPTLVQKKPAAAPEPLPRNHARATKKATRSAATSEERYSVDSDEPARKARDVQDLGMSSALHETPVEGVQTRARKARGASKSGAASPVAAASRRRSSRHTESIKREPSKLEVRLFERATSHRRSTRSSTHAEESSTELPSPKPAIDGDNRSLKCHDCILVHTDSTCPSPETSPMVLQDTTALAPSSSAVDEIAQNVSTRKRKRRAKGGQSHKRRRSADKEALSDVVASDVLCLSPSAANELSPQTIDGVETRSGLRKRQLQPVCIELGNAQEEHQKQIDIGSVVADSGDTDDEVLSQLVSESHAASQQSLAVKACDRAWSDVNHSRDTNRKGETAQPGQRSNSVEKIGPCAEVAEDAQTPQAIMDTLRGGLEQLRNAALTREKVYEMEDLLMDMKRELFEAERRGRSREQTGRQF